MQSHGPRVSLVVIDQDHGSLGMHLGRTSQLDSKKDNGPLHLQGMTDSDAAMRLRVCRESGNRIYGGTNNPFKRQSATAKLDGLSSVLAKKMRIQQKNLEAGSPAAVFSGGFWPPQRSPT